MKIEIGSVVRATHTIEDEDLHTGQWSTFAEDRHLGRVDGIERGPEGITLLVSFENAPHAVAVELYEIEWRPELKFA
jgi:hypothetical protein